MKTKFNWEDPFFLSEQLSDDERAVRRRPMPSARKSCSRAC